ncbi:MAG TPA: DUF4912 domain-containing protein [Pyrinomonadaceae bacterium]|mgnify:CR=1 FL=1|nr:DUF4912 domain-containing protein [Pyrinomonadaceae bacterium]
MNEDNTKDLLNIEETTETREFVLSEIAPNTISSAEMIDDDVLELEIPAPKFLAKTEESEEEIDPIFAELSLPVLPELQKENRAQLQMQSPNRLYFYWSIKNNPFQTLKKVFGGNSGNYQLVAKLVNQDTEREELHAVEAEGNWWFNVESNANYRAELGFYAPNRPFIRVMYSNSIETPRKNPSPRIATEADWAITATEFAEVLDNSGFTRDAFEVALAGDDFENSEVATDNAFYQFIGERKEDFSSDEVRYAILALASGVELIELRGQISESLYTVLQENLEKLSAENAMSALKEHFDVFDEEIIEEETIGATVFGASLINFPKKLTKRAVPKTLSPKNATKLLPKLSPLSSFSLRS